MKKIFAGLFVLISCLTLFACDSSSENSFGFFTHNGYALTSFRTETLKNVSEAKSLISNGSPISLASDSSSTYTTTGNLTDAQIEELMDKYSSVTVKTKYWENDSDTPENKTTNVTSTDMEKMFKLNEYTISTGMIVKNIYINEVMLDEYEELNKNFNSIYAPFKEIYSYHKDSDDRFVLQTNDHAEISAENIGGVSALFIQQNEILYNDNNIISKFQSSFGMQFQTPGGTQNQGTVLEVEFIWNLKI